MILPTKGMIFRKKYGGDKEPIDTRTYKSFFSKKVSKSHFLAENEAYIFNIQNFTMNETSLKMEGEVSSKVSGSAFIPCIIQKKAVTAD